MTTERSGEMEIDMTNFRVGWKDVGEAAVAFPKEHPKVMGGAIAAATIAAATLGVEPASALDMDMKVTTALQEGVNGIKGAVDYAAENWYWLVPTVAAIDATYDTAVDTVAQNKAREAANQKIMSSAKQQGQKITENDLYPQVDAKEFFNMWRQKALAEGSEMVTAILAAKAVTSSDLNITDPLRYVGYVSVGSASIYAALPDSIAGKVAKGINKVLGGVASGLTTVNARAAKQI